MAEMLYEAFEEDFGDPNGHVDCYEMNDVNDLTRALRPLVDAAVARGKVFWLEKTGFTLTCSVEELLRVR